MNRKNHKKTAILKRFQVCSAILKNTISHEPQALEEDGQDERGNVFTMDKS